MNKLILNMTHVSQHVPNDVQQNFQKTRKINDNKLVIKILYIHYITYLLLKQKQSDVRCVSENIIPPCALSPLNTAVLSSLK